MKCSRMDNISYQKQSKEKIIEKTILIDGKLPTKVFEERDSVLTGLMENKHILTIQNIFIALHFGIAIYSISQDYIIKNELRLGFDLLYTGFKGFYVLVVYWLCAFVLSLLPYYCIQYWNTIRIQFKSNALLLYTWDRIWLLCNIVYIFALLAFATTVAVHYDLGFVTVMCMLCEQVRMVMKTHAFVRTIAPRCLAYTTEKQNRKVVFPKLSQYLYFLFAPTLLYRDNCPRSQRRIRWGYVLSMFMEVAAGAFFYTFILNMSFLTDFREYGLKPFTPGEILLKILKNGFWGMLTVLLLGYLVLHAWLNAFAEMLRFSDKLFYKDWWTSIDYGRYYRTWNIVVHDWLYTYIYKDFYEIVIPKRKILANLSVFFISSLFHDFIVSVAAGYFIPVFLVYLFLFGSCANLVKITNPLIGNVLFLYSLALGASVIISTHYMEYFARVNCAGDESSLKYFFTPKILTCLSKEVPN